MRFAREAAQLGGTVLILALVPGGVAKTLAFLVWWALTLGRLAAWEAVLFAFSCVFFTIMDIAAVRNGVFAFAEPDFAGLPLWEVFLWGFYIVHGLRVLGHEVPKQPLLLPATITVLYCAAFATIQDDWVLLAASGGLLAVALAFFHDRADLRSVAYFVLMGAIVEYTGVLSGQWSYPAPPAGGVALWFVTLWGGVGLLLRRLVLPVIARLGLMNSAPAR